MGWMGWMVERASETQTDRRSTLCAAYRCSVYSLGSSGRVQLMKGASKAASNLGSFWWPTVSWNARSVSWVVVVGLDVGEARSETRRRRRRLPSPSYRHKVHTRRTHAPGPSRRP